MCLVLKNWFLSIISFYFLLTANFKEKKFQVQLKLFILAFLGQRKVTVNRVKKIIKQRDLCYMFKEKSQDRTSFS